MNAVGMLISIVSIVSGPSAKFLSLFELQSVQAVIGDGIPLTISYRLFIPRTIKDSEQFPLIVWLHGFGERGDDAILHLRWIDQLVLTNANDPSRYRFFLLAIQVPESEQNWYRNQLTLTEAPELLEVDMLHIASNIIDKVTSTHSIDPNKIVVTGVSMGGGACWELAIRYPERFAAIAPISQAAGALDLMPRLQNTPVWAFNCSHDTSSPLKQMLTRIDAINASGGNARLTTVSSHEHDAWTSAFLEHHLIEWLLAQDRSSKRLTDIPLPYPSNSAHAANISPSVFPRLNILIPAILLITILPVLLYCRKTTLLYHRKNTQMRGSSTDFTQFSDQG